MRRVLVCALTSTILALATGSSAQPLGTFRWQLQPYCNLIAVSVVQEGTVYRLEGTDDQCGGRDLASVTGLAFPNPDGTIGFGLTIVTTPGGTPVHVDADVTLGSLSGTWRDSTGGTGRFVFAPNGAGGGSPRPAVTTGIPPSVLLLNGGAAPDTSGARMLWHASKRAFRAGEAEFGAWNDTNIGTASAAFGHGTLASGQYSTASGDSSAATAYASTALGSFASASAPSATALGDSSQAHGNASTAMGSGTTASGVAATAMGQATLASNSWSTALGLRTVASGLVSVATGMDTRASGETSFAGGDNTLAAGAETFAFGLLSQAVGTGSVAIGTNARATANAPGSILLADRSPGIFESILPNEFGVRAAGGVYFYTRSDLGTGVALAPNGSSWAALSDVNAKENFRDVDGEDVLAKLSQVPVREWNYKAQDAGIRHIGPTAQDFRAAFGLGDFPLRINTIDADGVALAAVKALEARTRALPETAATLARLEATCAVTREQLGAANADLAAAMREVRALRDRLNALEQALNRR